MYLRFKFCDATNVVPIPANKSRTISFLFVELFIKISIKSIGFSVSCRFLFPSFCFLKLGVCKISGVLGLFIGLCIPFLAKIIVSFFVIYHLPHILLGLSHIIVFMYLNLLSCIAFKYSLKFLSLIIM